MTSQAVQLYDKMCAYLESKKWKFRRNDEELVIDFSVEGDDLPMDFIMIIDSNIGLIRLLSPLPFKFGRDKRIEGAIATCFITNKLADGSFDYDINDGCVYFRLTASFINSDIGTDLIDHMINYSAFVVDKFNDKFLAVNEGMISITEFLGEG